MPLPIVIMLAFVLGLAAAFASRVTLRLRPRSPLLSQSFAAFVIFMALIFVPSSLYFYIFFGDWFLLYLVDSARIPSALALLAFLGLIGLGTAGFSVGAAMTRAHHDGWCLALMLLVLLVGTASLIPVYDRVAWVGSLLQFRAHSGVEPYLHSSAWYAAIFVAAVLSVGSTYLLVQLVRHARRT